MRCGYRRARVEDVSRMAGIGKGSVYLLFESKEALYLEVIDACMSRLWVPETRSRS
jgi:AcrR family transcriptional regulator